MALRRLCAHPGCTATVESGRCAQHRHASERQRGTRQQRGYDAAHDAARRDIAASLPAPCHYCPRLVFPSQRWVAAHVVDGHPEFGWAAAHPECNERAKVR